jgi:hypothetical protein
LHGHYYLCLWAVVLLLLRRKKILLLINSRHGPIAEGDVMMKRTLWRRVDLKEKQNISMFSKNNEITRYLLEAAKAGLIDAYTNDSCATKITSEELHKRIVIPNQTAGLSAEEIAAGFGEPAKADDGWNKKPKADPSKTAAAD